MKKYWIGFLLLVILTSSVYILLPDNIRIDVGKTKTTFQVWENEEWVLAGTERTLLMDGTRNMRASSREIEYFIDGTKTKIVRTANFKQNITAIDTYYFDGGIEDVELYPVEHTVEIFNGIGKTFVYEVKDLEYFGETIKDISSPQSFGHKMKVEWSDGNYYSKIWGYKYRDIGKLTVKYKIENNYSNYSVRLFDPTWEDDLNDWLVSYYDFEEASGNLTDKVGSNDATLTSNISYQATGKVGYAYDFEVGDSSYVNIPDILNVTASHSICFWLKEESTENEVYFIGRRSPNSNYYLRRDTATLLWASGSAMLTTFENPNDTRGDWNYYCFIYDYPTTNKSLYINSVLNGTDVTASIEGLSNFSLGKGAGSPSYDGLYDELGFWNKTLEQDEIDFLYNLGFGCVLHEDDCGNIAPIVTLNSPTNNTNFTDANSIPFNCTASDNTNLINVSFMLDGVVNETNSSGLNDTFYTFDKILSAGPHNWTCRAVDERSVVTTADERFVNMPYIYFEDETESNDTIKNQTFVYANVTVRGLSEANITFELYWQNGTLTDSTFSTNPIRERNWTSLDYGIYLYNVTVFDISDNSNSTETRTIYSSNIFLFLYGIENDTHIELNTSVNITGNSSIDFGLVCIDIDHPDYGYNYTCSDKELTLNFTINYFRKNTFWNGTTTWNFSDFKFNGTHFLTNESLNFTSHQYDEIDDLRFNISGSGSAENIAFYRSNTSILDRYYQGFLIGSNVYLNQSVNSAGDTFNNWSNITFDNPGNATVYFSLDDNAIIQNITMNVTGKSYGFSYFDEFDTFENISVSETTAQLHYGPGGFIQSPNSSLSLRTFDDFNDASIASHWTNSSTESGGGFAYGVREIGGYLEAYASIDLGYTDSVTKVYSPLAPSLWYYTSDYLSFGTSGYYKGTEGVNTENHCQGINLVRFGNVSIFSSTSINSENSGDEESTSLVNFELTKINNTYWEVNLSGTEVDFTANADDCDDTGSVTRIYNYTNGTTDTNWADLDCTDTSVALDNSTFVLVDEASVILYFSTFINDATGCDGTESYQRLDNLYNKMWNRTNGTVISNSVFDASSNIISATMNYSVVDDGNYSFSAYMSADNGVNWESITSGVEKTFNFPGKHIKWRIFFNTTIPSYQNATAYLINVTIETPVSSASDIEFDFGDDGIWDYKINGTLNESNNTLTISMPNADISNSFTTRRALYSHIYQIPMRIFSATSGQIDLDIFNITYNPNPVIVNYTSIQTFLNTYGSNETNFTITIGGVNGTVNVSDIKLDYAGGNDTIEITIRDVLNTFSVTRYIYPYYSRWDYLFGPLYVNFLEFIPSTPTSLNVTPYGQTNSTPILNLTNYGYGDRNANLSVYLNDTHSCVNLTMSTTWDKEDGYQINSTWRELQSANIYLNTTDIFMWADYNCSWNNWNLFNPYIYFRQCCDGCKCAEDLG